MENPPKETAVAMAPGFAGLRVVDDRQQAYARSPNVTRRRMLTALATAGVALAQGPMVAPVMAQARPEALSATRRLQYFLNVSDFLNSLVDISAAPIPFQPPHIPNTTTATKYIAGVSNIYKPLDARNSVGRCSASFLCYKNNGVIYTDISNFISVDNGLIVSWFTPTTLINLALDTIINSMVTECIVVAATKIGVNPFYGETFNLKVSSRKSAGVEQIHFEFTEI
jgi:hypothetical protein